MILLERTWKSCAVSAAPAFLPRALSNVSCCVLPEFWHARCPCLRSESAAELLIKRLMIKLSGRDSWTGLLAMSDRGHALPSQPRTLPPAESRPCLDAVPSQFCVWGEELQPVPRISIRF